MRIQKPLSTERLNQNANQPVQQVFRLVQLAPHEDDSPRTLATVVVVLPCDEGIVQGLEHVLLPKAEQPLLPDRKIMSKFKNHNRNYAVNLHKTAT